MNRNSTIRVKTGQCEMCPPAKGKQPLTKGLCSQHYWLTVRLKSAQKFAEKETINDEGLPELRDDLDAVFSRWIRLHYAANGRVSCFTCDKVIAIVEAQCGHYIKRGNMFLRYDERNTKVQCKECNEYKDGMFIEFGKRLEQERPGITEILMEEGNIVYKFTRDELRALITDYKQRIKILNNETN